MLFFYVFLLLILMQMIFVLISFFRFLIIFSLFMVRGGNDYIRHLIDFSFIRSDFQSWIGWPLCIFKTPWTLARLMNIRSGLLAWMVFQYQSRSQRNRSFLISLNSLWFKPILNLYILCHISFFFIFPLNKLNAFSYIIITVPYVFVLAQCLLLFCFFI